MPSDVADANAKKKTAEPHRRKWKRYLLLGFLVVIFGGEVGLRVLADSNSKFNIFIGAGREWDPTRGVRLKKNYEGAAIKTNSKGFLGPEFESEKPAGGYRIVVLGDSCTFMPVRGNYTSMLQDRLRQQRPDRTIDVINASVPGYDSYRARKWYEDEIDAYEHDMLIIYLGWNDMGQFGPDALKHKLHEQGYLEKPTLLQRALVHSYILRSTYVVKGYMERRRPVSLHSLSEEDARRYIEFYPIHFQENIEAIVRLAKSRDRLVFLLNYAGLVSSASPTEDELARMHFPRNIGKSLPKYRLLKASYDRALQTVSENTRTPIIDIESLFSTPEQRKVFHDSMHFNRNGSEQIGRRVCDEIWQHVL